MARRKVATTRNVLPDPRFNDLLVAKFINTMMLSGKKAVTKKIMYGALDRIAKKTNKDAVLFFKEALNNIKPTVEVRTRNFRGSTYQVPSEVRESRRITLAMRWLIEGARKKNKKGMEQSLADELMEANEDKGFAFKKKNDILRMARANKAFSHFRW